MTIAILQGLKEHITQKHQTNCTIYTASPSLKIHTDPPINLWIENDNLHLVTIPTHLPYNQDYPTTRKTIPITDPQLFHKLDKTLNQWIHRQQPWPYSKE